MKKAEKTEYEAVKKSALSKFKRGQLVTKKKLLKKLITDNKIPIEVDRYKRVTSGVKKGQRVFDGAKSAEDIAAEIFNYYEKTDNRTSIPAVFNEVFPEGIDAVKAPPPVKKKPVTVKPAEVDLLSALQQQLSKRGDVDADVVVGDVAASRAAAKQERLDKEREEAGRALLLVTKLKKLPSITTADEIKTDIAAETLVGDKNDPDAPPPLEIEDVDQTAAGVVVRTLANQKRGQPLSTNEIDNMMHSCCARTYLGTYPADFLKFLPTKLPKIFSFVMNTDPSSKPGKHWVAVRVDTRDENAVEYYDSFGEEPSKRFMKQLKKLVNKLDVPIYLKLKINRIKEQNTSTNNCGWFAMSFIINRNLGQPFRECTGYDDSQNGEGRIDSLKNKFGYV